ncbi:MAG TPA: hypothetical protein VFS97_02545 [Nitrososphaeraceae archaeon]|nr:hypothetical protein [Nitrososphaeraceae archaeon]
MLKLSNGKNFIEGMTVTGFGNEEMPKRGAIFKYGGPNKPFVVVSSDGRLITGQQNRSGSVLGQKLLEVLSKQEGSVSARP